MFLLGHFLRHAGHAHGLAGGVVSRAAAHLHPMQRIVRPKAAIFDVIVAAVCQRLLDGLDHGVAIVGMNRGDEIFISERLVGSPPEIGFACRGSIKPVCFQVESPSAKSPGGERDAQLLLAFPYRLQAAPRFVLPPSRSQPSAGKTNQRRWVKRSLQKRDVAERLKEAPRRRIAFQAATALGQQDEREIRPFLLGVDEAGEAMEIGATQRLLRHDREAGTGAELIDKRCNVGSYRRFNTGFGEHGRGNRGIAASRRQDQSSAPKGSCSRARSLGVRFK